MRIFLNLTVILAVVGCAGPSRWALDVESGLKCGMTVEQVEALAGAPVVNWPRMAGRRSWITHGINTVGETDIWLGFENGKLRYVKIGWTVGLDRMATYARQDLCAVAEGDSGDKTPVAGK